MEVSHTYSIHIKPEENRPQEHFIKYDLKTLLIDFSGEINQILNNNLTIQFFPYLSQ